MADEIRRKQSNRYNLNAYFEHKNFALTPFRISFGSPQRVSMRTLLSRDDCSLSPRKLARLRAQLLEPGPGAGGPGGEGFDVSKSGDARIALVGFPS